MPSLNPSAQQLAHYAEAMPAGTPVLMLNLLRYHRRGQLPSGSAHAPAAAARPTPATAVPRRPRSRPLAAR